MPNPALTEPAAAFMCSPPGAAAAAASVPEHFMTAMRFLRGGLGRACFVVAALLAAGAVAAAQEFPFDREMILDTKRLGGLKRLPILTVEPNGKAVIDLWCQTVQGRVEIADSTIKIEAAPLPEGLPSMMVAGQCSPERMQADQDLIAALTQATEWRWQNGTVVLTGPQTLRFRASSH
jgi:hypothetical protein